MLGVEPQTSNAIMLTIIPTRLLRVKSIISQRPVGSEFHQFGEN